MGQRQWIRGFSRLVLVIALLAALLPSPLTIAQGTAVFSRIDVAGNQRIEADTVRVFAGIEPGQPVTPEQMNLAVRKLFDTGLFEDVTVMPEAGRLVITVVENPTINQIAFEGNDALDDDKLSEVIQLRPRLAYSVPAAEADAQRIIDAYRRPGRYAASVSPVIIRQPENRVDLVFEIDEGRKTGIQRINFVGNEVFSDRRLRRVIQTSQPDWLSFIFGNNTYDADRLEVDKELLRQFYLERGYIDFQVLSSTADLARERNGFFLSFTVVRGRSATTSARSRSARRSRACNAADFQPLLRPRCTGGGVYNVKQVDRVVQRMTYQAGQARLRLRRDPAAGHQEPRHPHRRHQLPAGRGPAGLHRAHRHLRQHPHARPGDPAAVPRRRGRRLQRARGQGRRGPHQRPRLLQERHRQRPPGHRPRTRR